MAAVQSALGFFRPQQRKPGPQDNNNNDDDSAHSPGQQLLQQPLVLDPAQVPLALDDADMTLLGLFATVSPGNGTEPNDDHRHNCEHHDMSSQDRPGFLGSSLHHGISHHNLLYHDRQQDHIAPQDALNATQDMTTAHDTNHYPYFPTTAESSSTLTTTPPPSTILNPPQPHHGPHGSKRKQPAASPGPDPDGHDEVAIKRQRNTMAARKYRQKRLDRIAHLKCALTGVTGERDELRLQLARREAEVDALREMLARK
ncbi:Purine-cytosine permease FCY22 [Tolypocladium capitatum]|uniref:Purine-cytosine permease FCY22 n=1 Tax=Tolypocladium capitatum TaxID=45235 RepID=A0A2K3QAR8_9HYPO|nr:Purine-cytosine permease FCY22 [Tolypocladium capitatum]